MRTTLLAVLVLAASTATAAEPNVWVKHDAAQIEGRRWDVPVGYSPELKRFVVLGGRTSWSDAKKPRSYDVLSLDTTAGKWRNELPAAGKDWGGEFGPVNAPAWKSESWGFTDASGNTRPNWSIYGTFSLGGLYAHNPDNDSFYFHAGNSTFRYQPKDRVWSEVQQLSRPAVKHGGILLWSSMTYDQDAKRFILFGGGNIQTERGDPGTWTFDPETKKWEQLEVAKQPPARANSRLLYDPVRKVTLLFGGDQLDQLVADTWAFDHRKKIWTELKPEVSPSPRGGHALLWLPKAKKILLLGGFTYTSTTDYVAPLYKPMPFEAWTLDVEANKWEPVARWEKDAPVGAANGFLGAAVDADDNVMVLDSQNRAWTCQIDLGKPDGVLAKFGVVAGSVVRRTGSHDPKWYTEGRPAPDAAAVAERLKKIPVNEWVKLPTDNAPKMNMDWGSAVFDSANDKILRFSGGHSAYSGTAPFVYDIKSDRYSLPFAPEYPLEYVYSNDQVNGEWSFQGRPWMTGHTYKSTGYDPNLKAMVFAAHGYTQTFDAIAGKWSRFAEPSPFRADFYNTTVCSTPEGAVAWGRAGGGGAHGIWRLHTETKIWKALSRDKAAAFPDMSPDHHGLAFDSKRNRLLFFSDIGKHEGNVAAYDIATAKTKWLDPTGVEEGRVHCRETVYLPDLDIVLIGARRKDSAGNWRWLAFDCAANGWASIALAGDDPIGKRPIAFNNSMGLMYDAGRKLVWAVGQHSEVYVLNIDRSKADIKLFK
ncbi:MAG: hypothetical protein K8U57_08400 [Planctomycetes bacterium]|nr:hypothetical protein [Planctomycetota bacterium]